MKTKKDIIEEFIKDNYGSLMYLADENLAEPEVACKEHLRIIAENSLLKILDSQRQEMIDSLVEYIENLNTDESRWVSRSRWVSESQLVSESRLVSGSGGNCRRLKTQIVAHLKSIK